MGAGLTNNTPGQASPGCRSRPSWRLCRYDGLDRQLVRIPAAGALFQRRAPAFLRIEKRSVEPLLQLVEAVKTQQLAAIEQAAQMLGIERRRGALALEHVQRFLHPAYRGALQQAAVGDDLEADLVQHV